MPQDSPFVDLNIAQEGDIKFATDTQQTTETEIDSQEKPPEKPEGETGEGTEQAEGTDEKKPDTPGANTSETEKPEGTTEEKAPEGEGEGETPSGETEETKPEDKPEAPSLDDQLKEISGGVIENQQGLQSLLEENKNLKTELEKPREPEFKSERAKKAYEYLVANEGEFGDLTQQQHQMLGMNVEGMDDKELQFEAFALKRPEISRADARKVFDFEWQKLFGDMTDDPDDPENILLNDQMRVRSIEAKATIKTARDNLATELAPKESEQSEADETQTQQASEADRQQVQQQVQSSLNDYQKIEIGLGKDAKEKVSIALDKTQVDALANAMTNPAALWDAVLGEFQKGNGEFDYSGYRDFIANTIHHDQIVQEVYNQGLNDGKIDALKTAKKPETETPTSTPKPTDKTFFDAWKEAQAPSGN